MLLICAKLKNFLQIIKVINAKETKTGFTLSLSVIIIAISQQSKQLSDDLTKCQERI